jgi:hypothetical protein
MPLISEFFDAGEDNDGEIGQALCSEEDEACEFLLAVFRD